MEHRLTLMHFQSKNILILDHGVIPGRARCSPGEISNHLRFTLVSKTSGIVFDTSIILGIKSKRQLISPFLPPKLHGFCY